MAFVAGVIAVAVAATVTRPRAPEPRQQRFAAQWRSVDLSADRRTITVVTSYPLAGFCTKEPAGVTVEVDGRVARVAAWVAEAAAEGSSCTAECGVIQQSVTLKEPLPKGVVLEPVPGAVTTC